MDETISVEVGEDHLAAFRRSPKIAIAELIWNSLDADATKVTVEYELNALDGINAVIDRDDGTGMTPTDAAFGFRNFGNSWKRTASKTPSGRSIHGKLGRGRYTAYSIGEHPAWTSIAEDGGVRRRLTVTGSASNLRNVRITSETEPTDDPTGTVVRIDQLTEQAQRELMHESIWQDLTTRFAPYLEQYPGVSIVYRGNPLNPAGLRDRTDTSTIRLEGTDVEAVLNIIEWKLKVDRRLYLCDENGYALADVPPGVQAPGYQFTAYLRWAGFQEIGSVIEVSKRIANRLDFLSGLGALIFDADSKKQTLERRQLHRILANETWVFGEEWALTGDDDRLTQVLAAHLDLLGEDVELASRGPVLREGGRDAIPDLVLSRTLETAENKYEHLVVELKRPAHTLTSADIEQLRSYAVAVADDDRFQQPNVRWTYVMIGNSTNTSVDDQRVQLDQPYGRVQITKRYSIWVRSWSEAIGDAQHRHKFVQQSLDYTTNHDAGVQYLREKHRQYLPDAMLPVEEALGG